MKNPALLPKAKWARFALCGFSFNIYVGANMGSESLKHGQSRTPVPTGIGKVATNDTPVLLSEPERDRTAVDRLSI